MTNNLAEYPVDSREPWNRNRTLSRHRKAGGCPPWVFYPLVGILLWGPGLPVPAQTGPPDEHEPYTIRKGDTLWDISGDKLQNPFLWPGLWKANPYIVNPDLIYPDKKLFIPNQPAMESAAPPAAVVPVPEPSAPESPAPEVAGMTTTQEEEPEQREEQKVEQVEQKEGEETAGSSPMLTGGGMAPPLPESVKRPEGSPPAGGPAPSIPYDQILASGFITQGLSPTGVISGIDPLADDKKNFLSQGDRIAIQWKKGTDPRAGESYVLYRPVHPVSHPATGQRVGDLIEVVGTVKIASIQGQSGIGVILSSFDYAFSGDGVIPVQELGIQSTPPSVPPAPAPSIVPTTEGTIVDILHGNILAGQFDVVYLDRGSSQGVIPGRRFSVHREHLEIGEVLIISTQKNTATALVTQSREDLASGDKIR
jgi:hypothetical protein